MVIPADEAATALRDVEIAAGRTAVAQHYQSASAYLFLWGAVWVVANLASQASLQLGQLVWLGGVLIGVAASVYLAARQKKSVGGGGLRSGLIAAAIAGFGLGVSLIAPPLSFAQSSAVAALAVGAVYLAMGSVAGLRLSAVGVAVIVATLLGWFFARDFFFVWMALTGGGALVMGGLWFRKV